MTSSALREEADRWLERDPDPKTRAALRRLMEDEPDALDELFGSRLSFGTAGLRAVVGPGPQRMNRLVVEETSLGLGGYVAEHVPDARTRGIVVGYDARMDSRDFAEAAAAVFLALGFKTYLFDEACPTPIAAFALTHLNASAAVVLTASHNPPEYNGYKVYWEDGAQIVPPHDAGIADAIERASQQAIPRPQEASPSVQLGAEIFDAYKEALGSTELPYPLRIAYSAMHGVGGRFVEELVGSTSMHFYPVESQFAPDGAFPTVAFPNPEEAGAMDLLLKTAEENGCDLALANDPDADRLAAAVLHRGGYLTLSGNDLGVLLGEYAMLKTLEEDRVPLVATTVVSSPLLAKIADDLGALCVTTLTGFKWLMHGLRKAEKEHPDALAVFAYEEALGYGHPNLVADKDGLSALMKLCALASREAMHERSLVDRLHELWRRYGVHRSHQESLRLSPETEGIMREVRAQPPRKIGQHKVVKVVDYLDSSATGLPATDALAFELDPDARIILRPSGTEPKIKCYYDLSSPPSDDVPAAAEKALRQLEALVEAHQASLGGA